MGIPADESLKLVFTGPDIDGTLYVATGPAGKATFVSEPTGEITHIEIPWADFVNGFCGRVDPDVTANQVTGSGPRVQEFINALASTP